jgi:hypothetical protein
MLTKVLSLVALLVMLLLLALSLPTYINSFSTNPSVTSIVMTGLLVLVILVASVMLLLFGVIGIKGAPAKR